MAFDNSFPRNRTETGNCTASAEFWVSNDRPAKRINNVSARLWSSPGDRFVRPAERDARCCRLLRRISDHSWKGRSDGMEELNRSYLAGNWTFVFDKPEPEAWKSVVVGSLLTTFAAITVLGNVLVIVAVSRERYLRTVTNYFIVSLSVADLLIGLVVMPFSISLEVGAGRWMFGREWCDLWHSFDVLASTASILNLSVISLDRYWAITNPIAYPGKMSTGRALTLVGLVWICSAGISFPAIAWWRHVIPDDAFPPDHECTFTEDPGYLIFSSTVSFYFPMAIILFAYYRIYRAATEQTRGLVTGSKVLLTSSGCKTETMSLRVHRGGYRGTAQSHRQTPQHRASQQDFIDLDELSSSTNSTSVVCGSGNLNIERRHSQSASPTGSPLRVPPSKAISRKWANFNMRQRICRAAKEQKAAKTLGIVVGVFCFCWVPFFVTNVVYGICHIRCVPEADVLFPVFAWLGYINSGMNPVIYAYSMRDFPTSLSLRSPAVVLRNTSVADGGPVTRGTRTGRIVVCNAGTQHTAHSCM